VENSDSEEEAYYGSESDYGDEEEKDEYDDEYESK
jgi:hypothetical protein